MGEVLLDLVPGEPLALVKKMPYCDNLKELYIMLVTTLQLIVHDPVHYSLLNVIRVELCHGQVLCHLQGVQQRQKVLSKKLHIKERV
jgi:hypothetical protein